MVKGMDANEFINRLDQFKPALRDDFQDFKKIIENYPFFQPAMIYLLKGARHHHPDFFSFLLQQAASMTFDRTLLYKWIKNPVKRKVGKRISNATTVKTEERKTYPKKTQKEIETPVEMNYLDWIRFVNNGQKPLVNEPMNIDKKIQLIDSFLSKNPKIGATPKDAKMVDLSKESWASNSELMTETLAKVFIKQKKYGKALKAYEILCLKYPEKNGFFANQIEEIKLRQQQKE